MQWNAEKNAGFTEGTPWYRVNPNYKEINVEQALADPESVFYHYQKLIQLRKEHEVMVYGTYHCCFQRMKTFISIQERWRRKNG